MNEQLELFGGSGMPSKATQTKWSFSKMAMFHDCLRKYYYHYFGSKKRTALKEPLKAKLIELSRISNKASVQGKIIHQVIGTYFNKAKKGDIYDLGRMESFALKMLSEAIQFTKAKKLKQAVAMDHQLPIIKELYYDKANEQLLWNEMRENFNSSFTNFKSSSNFKPFREGGLTSTSIVESDSDFNLTDSILVNGKIDLAFDNKDFVMIVDWKTGKPELQDTSLQLLVYALWAKTIEEYKNKPIRIKKAYIQKDEVGDLEYSDLHVQRAKVRVMQDVDLLSEMNDFATNSVSDAFTMRKQEKKCALCPYEEICYKW